MPQPYTARQKRIIQNAIDAGKPLTGTITISLGVPPQADLIEILEDNPDRFNGNISRLVRDMIQGYKVDWRNDNDSQLEEIKRMIAGLGRVTVNDNIVETNEEDIKLDAGGGFSEQ